MADKFERLLIVGVGLIGGSIGLAAKARGVANSVVGVGRRQASVDRALSAGVVDEATTDFVEATRSADIVVACTPVGGVARAVVDAATACAPDTLLTDAGSTKAGIVAEVDSKLAALDRGDAFVGSHPLAGDHRTGPEAARADLLEGRTVVLTPTDRTRGETADRIEGFWRSLGAEVVRMTPEAHDAAVAYTSHLPHVAAAALASITPRGLLELTGSGWADTTRVAAGDASLWRDILVANRQELAAALGDYGARLQAFAAAIESGDGAVVEQMLGEGKLHRDALGS